MFQKISVHISLDMASLAARIRLLPGGRLTFRWLELRNYAVEIGQAMLIIDASPDGVVWFDNAVLRRRAGFPATRYLQDINAMPRPDGSNQSQVAFALPKFCYNATAEPQGRCSQDVVYMVDVNAMLAAAWAPFLAPGVGPLGEYDMIATDTVHAVDELVNPECVTASSEWDCLVQLLRLLEIQPVVISSKASDSNLVKIVASLAILLVSVLLFLYFRRHYKTYQQRRARRMRRIKEALGMGPDAHGIMFNGLDGEEPDWQIMPMPVGYAADEEAPEPQLHQDSNLRNLIKDISNRPGREVPEYVNGQDLRIDADATNCPIAHETGLRPGGGGGGQGGSEQLGTPRIGSGTPYAAGGGTSTAGSGPLHHVGQPGIRHSIVTSNGTTTTASGSRPIQAIETEIILHGSGSARLHLTAPAITLTTAGMDALVANRAAARAAAIGSESTASGAHVHPASGGGAAGGVHASAGGAAVIVGGDGSDGHGASSLAPSSLGGTTAANRQAVTFTAADVVDRVMRSKDSEDSVIKEEGDGGQQSAQVANLMDELEGLRRDIMAGINDTQLQIMSVVGSGAFGTVYRGQWQGLEVAVKTVVFSASSENRKRALQEAALCQSINHRNIVATYAVDVQPLGAVNTPVLQSGGRNNATLSNLLDWRLYIVQEYCDGGPLRKLVQSRYLQGDAGPNMRVICEVALELAQALAHLHSKNIIHGDLNPNNVLLKRDATAPNGFRVKMADFGLSVMVPIQKTHMSNLRLGTLYYIAPETCFRGQLGYAADVFSLGVMLWELYHGRLAGTRTPTGEPRYQPDFPDFPPACPVDYRKLAHRCLQKQPHNRLHSSQVVQRLREMIEAYRAAAALGPPQPPLPPLPLGGPDDSFHANQPPGPMFAQHGAAHVAPALPQAPTGAPTPAESRHQPATPGRGGAAAAGPAAPAAGGGAGSPGGANGAAAGAAAGGGSTPRGAHHASRLAPHGTQPAAAQQAQHGAQQAAQPRGGRVQPVGAVALEISPAPS
ncbi:hypothetical protein HYH03_012541 [Edaphochlamys debaryana]|uniref:Protein kinase domain-containing protein n=1 Tax=Edaphochlamys debaryana TaxID=47281 RepID=A0A835XTV8_9CHLO|nr:hypothetical protein HYH03_012541 [Edaphochlamys debaryana]|eukprot:KAG2488918.1 hypothetical protein HYH03_012541 [Edaphochlamys debaryana]